MDTTTQPEKKLPAHLRPWPEHWLPKEDYLNHLKQPHHYFKIVGFFGAVADRNQVTAALGRLVKTGEAVRREDNHYYATGAAPQVIADEHYTPAQIAAACESIGRDPAPILRALRWEVEPEPTPELEALPASPMPSAPRFAGSPSLALTESRALLPDNETQALSLSEWADLATSELGIDLVALMRDDRAALLAGLSSTTREGDDLTAYWLPKAPPPDDDALPADV